MESDAVLSDPRYVMPSVPPGDSGVAWLRSAVARFSNGPDHARRRALAVDALDAVDPAGLRRAAMSADGPVEVLATALGLPESVADDVAVVAGSYQPHTEVTPEADAAVERLVVTCGGSHDEVTANRIGLLVQACVATKALVAHLLAGDDDPPVASTRRVAPDGDTVEVDLANAHFGAGEHACPGRAHALAIAAGLAGKSPQ
jgi:cytochrome P450